MRNQQVTCSNFRLGHLILKLYLFLVLYQNLWPGFMTQEKKEELENLTKRAAKLNGKKIYGAINIAFTVQTQNM